MQLSLKLYTLRYTSPAAAELTNAQLASIVLVGLKISRDLVTLTRSANCSKLTKGTGDCISTKATVIAKRPHEETTMQLRSQC
jgi:hypothetical protein